MAASDRSNKSNAFQFFLMHNQIVEREVSIVDTRMAKTTQNSLIGDELKFLLASTAKFDLLIFSSEVWPPLQRVRMNTTPNRFLITINQYSGRTRQLCTNSAHSFSPVTNLLTRNNYYQTESARNPSIPLHTISFFDLFALTKVRLFVTFLSCVLRNCVRALMWKYFLSLDSGYFPAAREASR